MQDNQFVLARDMIVSSNSQSVVVGFLCECDNAKNFTDNSWVKVTGTIVKGDYDTPKEEYVYPPDDSYIPTAGIL